MDATYAVIVVMTVIAAFFLSLSWLGFHLKKTVYTRMDNELHKLTRQIVGLKRRAHKHV